MSKLELKTSHKNGGRIVAEHQHPFDYGEERGELVPVQVRLPTKLSEGVKARLQKHDMTFTERIRGACHWYLEIPEEAITKKKDTCAGIHRRRHLFILSMKIGRSLVAEKFNENSLNPARANRGDEAAQELHLPRARWL